MNIFGINKVFMISTLICFVIGINGEFQNHENCGQTKSKFIVGGENAEEKEFPFMVSLQTMGSHFCGASVLNERWVLTAAHCIILGRFTGPSLIKLVMGSSDNKGLYVVKYNVEKWIINGCFQNKSGDSFDGDIALFKTDKDIDFNETGIGTICLPPKDRESPMKKMTIAGWGASSVDDDSTPNKLQKTQVTVFPEEYCREYTYFRNLGTVLWPLGKRICLIAENSTACRGDSGGPAFHTVNGKVFQFGIASFISGTMFGMPFKIDVTCYESNPTLYVKVSKYIDWITESIKNYSNDSNPTIDTKCEN